MRDDDGNVSERPDDPVAADAERALSFLHLSEHDVHCEQLTEMQHNGIIEARMQAFLFLGYYLNRAAAPLAATMLANNIANSKEPT